MADEVWHAGDIGTPEVLTALQRACPAVRAVHGNIDDLTIKHQYPEDAIFEVEGMRVWMTHIGGYPGRYSKRVNELWESVQPDLFICGHSHIFKIKFDKNRNALCINPGAAGTHGFHIMRTAIRFEIANARVNHLEVIEFGKRAQIL